MNTRFGGPYLIQDEVTNSVRKIDDPKYALVFIDGVLQKILILILLGPNITFTKPLQFSESKLVIEQYKMSTSF